MPTDKHPRDCECDAYACELRRKSISTQLDTGVSGMAGVTQKTVGQDGPKGRDGGGNLL